ncbi:MAG: hypothetical protein ABW049_11595 [Spongiibacteraceae bacterium]
MLMAVVGLSACGGGGGGGGGGSDAPAPAPSTPSSSTAPAVPNNNAALTSCPTLPAAGTGTPSAAAALKGRISFDRIPFFPAPSTPFASFAPGLDYANPVVEPARGVVVEAVAASSGSCEGTVLDTTVTDGDGWYALNVDPDRSVCVRARAQLYRAGSSAAGWNISVVDNTDNNRLYVMADSRFASARSQPRRDLHAASGWSGGSYTSARVAAPFAIADTACKAIDAILGVQPTAQFGEMSFGWSTRNTENASGSPTNGDIGGAFFSAAASAVYLRGDATTNTDEFDEMVIAHEFGHFATYRFSRSDSIGGDHSLLDYLDPRLAFDEGWASAFAGLVLQSRIYRDSDEVATSGSPSREFYFFLDDMSFLPRGWFTEGSVQSLIYSMGETVNSDGVALGFGPIWLAMIGAYKNGTSLQSIFSYASALKAANPADAGAIANLLNNQQISGDTIAEFAQTETHAPDTTRDLPLYRAIDTSATQRVCSRNQYALAPYAATDSPNKLSMIRLLRFDAPAAGNYRITATPDRSTGLAGLKVLSRGRQFTCDSGSSNIESLIAGNAVSLRCPLQNGSYVLAVYQTDFSNDANAAQGNYDQCFVVKAEVQ